MEAKGFLAIARGDMAIQFCRRRGVAYSFKVTFSACGERGAGVLSRAWCHRLQYYYNEELLAPEGPTVAFSGRHHKGYQEPTEVKAWLEEGVRKEALEKLEMIRGLFH
eukprot:10709164-Lingulodinium_polyedra.AAC.1